jgi:heat shock protein HtpX
MKMNFNILKTVLFLSILSSIFLLLGALFGGIEGITFAFLCALILNGIMYFFSEKIVLRLYGAKPLDNAEYAWIYEDISSLATAMQIPMPKLWLIDTPMANAFATGRNPHHASIAVTHGILSLLDKRELRGVLAHELSHIKNRDVLIATIAATMASSIGYLASFMRNISFNTKERKSSNIIFLFIISIIIPIAATLIQLAISRSREFLADETGAHCCQDPLALASALQKLHNHIPHASMDANDVKKASTAALFIVHPFTKGSMLSLFSTHPPVGHRVARLEQMHSKLF